MSARVTSVGSSMSVRTRDTASGRAARWGAGLLAAAHLVGLNAWAWQERQSLSAKQAAVRSTLTQTFPKVQVVVDWDQWKKGILKHAQALEADMIALKAASFSKRSIFGKQYIEYLIEKSPCQVVGFLSDTTHVNQWKQVVMPITDFIPETRIQTIANIARMLQLKVHLVTIATHETENRSADFYFLTETLKRLKPLGNIQVACRCLKDNSSHTDSFLRYAQEVGADIIITNRMFSHEYQGVSKQTQFVFEYV